MSSNLQDLSYFNDKHIFCFGFGYVANFLSAALSETTCKISGTTTSPEKKKFMEENGYSSYIFDSNHAIPDPLAAMKDVTHILLSIPPESGGDIVYDLHAADFAKLKNLKWVGYLSATAVYGDHDGGWVTEDTIPSPASRRGSLRLKAEEDWYSYYRSDELPLHIFRLAGIYGPGRSAIDSVVSGVARCIEKPGHVFSRIHVDDIVQVLLASMMRPHPCSIYNLADDMPAPSHEIILYACELLGIEPPPVTPFTQADIAPIMRSFFKDNKRIRNDKIKQELGIELMYPDYRKGLLSCMDVESELTELLKHT